MSKNYYAEAIKILEHELNYKALIYQIAAQHPKALVDAVEGNKAVFTKIEKEVAKVITETGQLIKAIKKHRELTNSSLVESKEACEALNVKMGNPLGLTR